MIFKVIRAEDGSWNDFISAIVVAKSARHAELYVRKHYLYKEKVKLEVIEVELKEGDVLAIRRCGEYGSYKYEGATK